MEEIAKLGHEIGYHYEDVDLASKKIKVKSKKNEERLIDPAYVSFCRNLEMLRKNFDIKTICMHGSPFSKFDNRIIWGKYDYKKLGLIGEPYFDFDWNIWGYLTDTGRRWNGNMVSVRDRVERRKVEFGDRNSEVVRCESEDTVYSILTAHISFSEVDETRYSIKGHKSEVERQKSVATRQSTINIRQSSIGNLKLVGQINYFKTTKNIINNIDMLPDKVMFTIHPERWTDNIYDWMKQLVLQNIKNVAKRFITAKQRQHH